MPEHFTTTQRATLLDPTVPHCKSQATKIGIRNYLFMLTLRIAAHQLKLLRQGFLLLRSVSHVMFGAIADGRANEIQLTIFLVDMDR